VIRRNLERKRHGSFRKDGAFQGVFGAVEEFTGMETLVPEWSIEGGDL
jgi:hypothetical protein